MKAAALTLVVALSLSASAFAQQEPRNEREYRDEYNQLTIGLRDSMPTGDAVNGVRWGDLITGGIGLELQYQELWRANSWIYGGWYAGVAVDSFGGRSLTFVDPTTSFTSVIRTHRLNTADLEFGGRLRQNFNGFHIDENVGVGAVAYMKEELDVRNGGPQKLEFIKSSENYLYDLGIRVGAPVGKDVELGLGLAFQVNGAPAHGKDFPGLHFKPQENLVLGLTLDIGF
jgi:hypothetical protein